MTESYKFCITTDKVFAILKIKSNTKHFHGTYGEYSRTVNPQ